MTDLLTEIEAQWNETKEYEACLRDLRAEVKWLTVCWATEEWQAVLEGADTT